MSLGHFRIPDPKNEPVLDYRPGSSERTALKAELKRQATTTIETGPVIDGKSVHTGDTATMVMPHDHGHTLGTFHKAGEGQVKAAIESAERARPGWAAMPFEERAAVFLRAATLLQGPFRDRLNASTMLGQSKTAYQAEIDAACELIDFYNFNVHYMGEIMEHQPISGPGTWNRVEYRPLDGFVFAVTPFNFTSIAGNLPTAPALAGNTVVWKPASTSVLSGHYIMELLAEAGLPPGVINFVPGSGAKVGDPVVADSRLGGIHFTGSTDTFQSIWKTVGNNIAHYGQYPRVVGETGGKDFIVAHPSADPQALITAIVRGAYEYQGQKCSAVSRVYVPKSLWKQVHDGVGEAIAAMAMGDVTDFRTFMGAVIDKGSFTKLKGAIDEARGKLGGDVVEIIGGECDDSKGWFISPTLIQVADPKYRTMCEELFGPVATVYVYDDAKWDETLALVDSTSPYALTGAVFADDRAAVAQATAVLRHAAGNFYVNDKPTGAVVGQQPFGGGRASGTNDKAGSAWNLIRWLSPRTIKENFNPPTDWRYPSMDEA